MIRLIALSRQCLPLMAALATFAVSAHAGDSNAAPQINNLPVRGLRIGATTTLTIEGTDLLPAPRVVLSVPIASQTVHPDATSTRYQVDIKLAAQIGPGLYNLRVANVRGISNAIIISIDTLEQVPFSAQIAHLPAALHGSLGDSPSLQTAFAGKKGQPVTVDIETRRLGSTFDPVLELYSPVHVLIAAAQPQLALGGDARLEAMLPADGTYTIELHDVLYRAGTPSFFRLKIGALLHADLAFPLGWQRSQAHSFELIGNLAAPSRDVNMHLRTPLGALPVPLPAASGSTGPAPRVQVSDFPEIVESAQPAGRLQEASAPVIINGRIAMAGEEDRYRLLVNPGMRLRFDLSANRSGSPLDALLTLHNEAGAQLAENDDRPESVDPALDFLVPRGMSAVIVKVRDIARRGGPEFLYRLSVLPADLPDFGLTVREDRLLVPQGGYGVLRVEADRRGHYAPIRLFIDGIPAGMHLLDDQVPAGTSAVLATVQASRGAATWQGIGTLVGQGTSGHSSITRPGLTAPTGATLQEPWLRAELGCAIIEASPLDVSWELAEKRLPIGGNGAMKVNVKRASGATGPVRLSLVTSQAVPLTQDKQGEDKARALRFDGVPMVSSGQSSAVAKVVVPGDLPIATYDLTVKAELLSTAGGVLASAVARPQRFMAHSNIMPGRPLAIFEDESDFINKLTKGGGEATLETRDKYSGQASVRVTPDQRYNEDMQGLGLRIRQNPAHGEYRFLQFAWRKKGGETICLQLNHDGKWGPVEGSAAKFRYHAGPGPECFGASLGLSSKIPREWTLITRDLYADFGEFTLTGLALSPMDGQYALFDHIYLGRTAQDFAAVAPNQATKK
jgi:hypothetical protein